MTPEEAEHHARRLLEGDRLDHVVAVATKAPHLAERMGLDQADAEMLTVAAWVHDIGYAIPYRNWHPLDGAEWALRKDEPRLASLIAWHTTAEEEALVFGHYQTLVDGFPPEHSLVADALTYLDMTTGPQGQSMDPLTRLADVEDRRGGDSSQATAMRAAWLRLTEGFNRVLLAVQSAR